MKAAGKVALVTGAGRRLGKAIALALARQGAHVAAHYYKSESEARQTVEEIRALGVQACAVQADQAREGEVGRAAAEAAAALGPIDILVNSAAIFERGPFLEAEAESWDRHMNVNLRGPYPFARAVAPEMRRRGAGKIVNLADVAAERPWPAYLAYSVSKAGVVALTRALARALAPQVQVNAVAPGIILPPESWDDSEVKAALERVPMKRPGAAEEIASTVLFLIEGPDYITGAVIAVDGGRGEL